MRYDSNDPYRCLSLAVLNQAIIDKDAEWLNGDSYELNLFLDMADICIDDIHRKRCRVCLEVLDEGYKKRHRGNLCYVCDLKARVKRLTDKKSHML